MGLHPVFEDILTVWTTPTAEQTARLAASPASYGPAHTEYVPILRSLTARLDEFSPLEWRIVKALYAGMSPEWIMAHTGCQQHAISRAQNKARTWLQTHGLCVWCANDPVDEDGLCAECAKEEASQ